MSKAGPGAVKTADGAASSVKDRENELSFTCSFSLVQKPQQTQKSTGISWHGGIIYSLIISTQAENLLGAQVLWQRSNFY